MFLCESNPWIRSFHDVSPPTIFQRNLVLRPSSWNGETGATPTGIPLRFRLSRYGGRCPIPFHDHNLIPDTYIAAVELPNLLLGPWRKTCRSKWQSQDLSGWTSQPLWVCPKLGDYHHLPYQSNNNSGGKSPIFKHTQTINHIIVCECLLDVPWCPTPPPFPHLFPHQMTIGPPCSRTIPIKWLSSPLRQATSTEVNPVGEWFRVTSRCWRVSTSRAARRNSRNSGCRILS